MIFRGPPSAIAGVHRILPCHERTEEGHGELAGGELPGGGGVIRPALGTSQPEVADLCIGDLDYLNAALRVWAAPQPGDATCL